MWNISKPSSEIWEYNWSGLKSTFENQYDFFVVVIGKKLLQLLSNISNKCQII